MRWLEVRHKDSVGNVTVTPHLDTGELFGSYVDEQGIWDDDYEFDPTKSPMMTCSVRKICGENKVIIEVRGNPNYKVVIGENLEVLENKGFEIKEVSHDVQ